MKPEPSLAARLEGRRGARVGRSGAAPCPVLKLSVNMPTSPDVIAALEGSADPDAKVLIQMASLGADLGKPHEPEFVFEAGTLACAMTIGDRVRALGFEVELYAPNDENPDHLVVAKRRMLLELDTLVRLSARFEALADAHGARYDGWGAEVVE